MKTIKSGDIFTNKKGLEFVVIDYSGAFDVTVMFSNGFVRKTRADHVKSGSVRNPTHPEVFGIGFIGDGIHKSRVNGKETEKYRHWHGMMTRCYSKGAKGVSPTYLGCTVCDEWHDFQAFSDWFDVNYIDGYHLDKDIISHGNKVYSPDKCMFVHRHTNSIFNKPKKESDLPLGISRTSGKDNYYSARCWVNGSHEEKCSHSISELILWYAERKTESVITHAEEYYPNNSKMMELLTCKLEHFLGLSDTIELSTGDSQQ